MVKCLIILHFFHSVNVFLSVKILNSAYSRKIDLAQEIFYNSVCVDEEGNVKAQTVTPTRRTCQFVIFSNGQSIPCNEELTGRGPRKWCSTHSKEMRRNQNRESQEDYRAQRNQRRLDLKWWHSFRYRQKKGMKISNDEVFAKVFKPYIHFPFLRGLIPSLRTFDVKQEHYPAAIDFHVFTKKNWAFTFTFFGPNPSFKRKGVGYGLQFGLDEELNRSASEALCRQERLDAQRFSGYRVEHIIQFFEDERGWLAEAWLPEDRFSRSQCWEEDIWHEHMLELKTIFPSSRMMSPEDLIWTALWGLRFAGAKINYRDAEKQNSTPGPWRIGHYKTLFGGVTPMMPDWEKK